MNRREAIIQRRKVTPRMGRVSRNNMWRFYGYCGYVTPRMGRVSRNNMWRVYGYCGYVTPRMGRVSRNCNQVLHAVR